jgi:hypothetical protein
VGYYTYEEALYSLRLPTTWSYQHKKDKTAVAFHSSEPKPNESAIIVQVWSVPKGHSPEELIRKLDEAALTLSASGRSTHERMRVAGRDTNAVVTDIRYRDRVVQLRHIAIPSHNWILDITTIEPNQHHIAEIREILASIVLKSTRIPAH